MADEMIVIGGEEEAEVAELESLAAELGKAARSKARRADVLDKIEALLKGMSDEDFKALADSPAVQKFLDFRARTAPKPADPPGTIYYFRDIPFTKKPWTEADLKKSDIPIVEFELEEPVDFVGWNGLRRSYGPGVHRDYACFRDQIRHAREQRKFTEEHRKLMLPNPGETAQVHRDMLDGTTQRVRAMSATGGSEHVGAGTVEGIAYAEEAEGAA